MGRPVYRIVNITFWESWLIDAKNYLRHNFRWFQETTLPIATAWCQWWADQVHATRTAPLRCGDAYFFVHFVHDVGWEMSSVIDIFGLGHSCPDPQNYVIYQHHGQLIVKKRDHPHPGKNTEIYIKGLPKSCTIQDLFYFVESCGTVYQVSCWFVLFFWVFFVHFKSGPRLVCAR